MERFVFTIHIKLYMENSIAKVMNGEVLKEDDQPHRLYDKVEKGI